jgi:hypothetical protein
MTTRTFTGLCLLTATAGSALPVHAQDITMRLSRRRFDDAVRLVAADLPAPATGGTQSGAPTATDNSSNTAAMPRRREISASVNTRIGFDRQELALGNPAVPVLAKRRIASVNLSLSYPLTQKTSMTVSVPYINQRSNYSSPFGNVTLKGRGIGDVGLYLQHNFGQIAKGTQLSASLGVITPTGKSVFNAGPNELPTGVGFYQPVARLTLSKLRVPLQFYAAADYGTSFSRRINGTRVTLPNSYGGELGFYYTMSPEFTTQTSVSVSKVTSPFIDVPGATVGYLSQGLTYQANQRTSVQASVDVGLTEESTDAFVGVSLDKRF